VSLLLIIVLVWTGMAALVIVAGMGFALYHSYREPPRYLTLTATADDLSTGIEEELEREAA
jgi:hypothetical protein